MAKRESATAARADLDQGEIKKAETGAAGQLVTGIGTGFTSSAEIDLGEVSGICNGDPT
jgi:hypothetical protein